MSRTAVIVTIEAIAFLVSLVLGVAWIRNPTGPYEPYIVVAGLVLIATEGYRRYEGRLFKTEGTTRTPAELIQHRESLRKQFEEEIYRCRLEKLRKDVIVRHVNRVDSCPNVEEKSKGISPWFRVGLIDTYHRGIKVGLRWGSLKGIPSGFRYTNHRSGEKGDKKVLLVGEIPYEFIEAVNMDGDEYYNFPHIYCHFANKGEPYERLIYCEEIDTDHGHTYYIEVATYEEVARNSKGSGVEYFA